MARIRVLTALAAVALALGVAAASGARSAGPHTASSAFSMIPNETESLDL